jgi:hypothetical protein
MTEFEQKQEAEEKAKAGLLKKAAQPYEPFVNKMFGLPLDVLYKVDDFIMNGDGPTKTRDYCILKSQGKPVVPDVRGVKRYMTWRMKDMLGKDTMQVRRMQILEQNEKLAKALEGAVDLRTTDPKNLEESYRALAKNYQSRIEVVKEMQESLADPKYEAILRMYLDSYSKILDNISQLTKPDGSNLAVAIFRRFLSDMTPMLYQAFLEVCGNEKIDQFKEKFRIKVEKMDMPKLANEVIVIEATNSKGNRL